jgi:hypothetical protein
MVKVRLSSSLRLHLPWQILFRLSFRRSVLKHAVDAVRLFAISCENLRDATQSAERFDSSEGSMTCIGPATTIPSPRRSRGEGEGEGPASTIKLCPLTHATLRCACRPLSRSGTSGPARPTPAPAASPRPRPLARGEAKGKGAPKHSNLLGFQTVRRSTTPWA